MNTQTCPTGESDTKETMELPDRVREEVMKAAMVIQKNIQLRLRLQQHHMIDNEIAQTGNELAQTPGSAKRITKSGVTPVSLSDQLTLVIGLIWGHLNARQYEDAYTLAKGCARVWPQEQKILLMLACAAVELHKPLEPEMLAALHQADDDCREWCEMILRRAQLPPKPG